MGFIDKAMIGMRSGLRGVVTDSWCSRIMHSRAPIQKEERAVDNNSECSDSEIF